MLIDWESAPQAPSMRAGAQRRVVTTEASTVVRITSSAEAQFDGREHRHQSEQWIILLSGSLTVTVDGHPSQLRPGDVVYVAPNQWHAASGSGPEGAEYLELSSPPRYDLLPGHLALSPMAFRNDSDN